MVKYCAVAVCRTNTHNRLDLTYFTFPEDHDREESWSPSANALTKNSRTLSIQESVHAFLENGRESFHFWS